MGTRFLMTKESTVPDAVKKVYLDTPVTGTVVTKAIDGYPQRVIRTPVRRAPWSGLGHAAGSCRARARHAWDFRALTGASMVVASSARAWR